MHLAEHLYAPQADRKLLYQEAMEMLSHAHGITEMTLQIEDDDCHLHSHTHEKHDHADHQHEHSAEHSHPH